MAKKKESDAKDTEAGQTKKRSNKLVAGVVLIIVGLYSVLVAVAIWHPGLRERVKFGTENGLSLAILIAVVAQVVIYRRQWLIMQKQAEYSRDQLIKIERPFVFFDGLIWKWHPAGGGRYWYSIHPTLINRGNMPTQEMTISCMYGLFDKPLPDDFDFLLSERGPTLIPPKGSIEIRVGRMMDEELLAIQRGTMHFYFWGEAIYRDGFEDTPTHVTRFCQHITDVGGDPSDPRDPHDHKGTTVEIQFGFYGEYNSAT